MKYIKEFERLGYLNKKTVDYNKVYVFHDIIGKISPNPGKGFRDTGCIIVGYNEDGQEMTRIVRYSGWKWIREATEDEIKTFNVFDKVNKYNL